MKTGFIMAKPAIQGKVLVRLRHRLRHASIGAHDVTRPH